MRHLLRVTAIVGVVSLGAALGCGQGSSCEGTNLEDSTTSTAPNISCGPGTVANGDQCVSMCQRGTRWNGSQCVPN